MADRMGGRTGWIGRRIAEPEIATLAGIRQAFPIDSKPAWLRGGLSLADCSMRFSEIKNNSYVGSTHIHWERRLHVAF